jgi:hypothetical protein
MHSPRRVDQRPSASGLASHYGPRVDGHREQTKRSPAGIACLSWSASLFELAMSASGHSRPSWSKPLGHALPLRPDSGRNDSSSSGRFGSENGIYPEQIMSRFLSKARPTMGALVPPASSAPTSRIGRRPPGASMLPSSTSGGSPLALVATLGPFCTACRRKRRRTCCSKARHPRRIRTRRQMRPKSWGDGAAATLGC